MPPPASKMGASKMGAPPPSGGSDAKRSPVLSRACSDDIAAGARQNSGGSAAPGGGSAFGGRAAGLLSGLCDARADNGLLSVVRIPDGERRWYVVCLYASPLSAEGWAAKCEVRRCACPGCASERSELEPSSACHTWSA